MARKPKLYTCDEVIPDLYGDRGDLLESCRDFTPSYPFTEEERAAYVAEVAHCRTLVGDKKAFEEAGCKREAHARIPRGRLSFVRPGTYHPYDPEAWREKDPQKRFEVTEATEARWIGEGPPLNARTQSPNVYGKGMTRTQVRIDELTQEIRAGLLRFAPEADGILTVVIPLQPYLLLQAGVPKAAATLLVRKLGGRQVWMHPQAERLSARARFKKLFAGADITFPPPNRDTAVLDLGEADLRRLSGRLRDFLPSLLALRRKNPMQLILSMTSTDLRGTVTPLIPNHSEEDLELDLEEAVQGPGQVTLVLGTPGDLLTLKLQHSKLRPRVERDQEPDYTTLQGFSLLELPAVLAQKVVSGRRKRRGRKRGPSTRQNPKLQRTPMAKRSRKNPSHSYNDDVLSSDPMLNKLTDWYYPGTVWDYYEEGAFNLSESVPVNRRNPSKRSKARKNGLTHKQLLAGFGGKAAQLAAAKSNPRPKRGAYWPRNSVYELTDGPFGATQPLPVNRRNPKSSGAKVWRFPTPCAQCGQSMQGMEYKVLAGRKGPRGGKVRAHKNCGR